MQVLPPSFYLRDDVLQISKELLGKFLVTKIDGKITSWMIVEVEAYAGECDRASHAFGNRHTQRTAPMFGEWGNTYVYLCYGIHHLLNVVTNNHGIPHAILIRWIIPVRSRHHQPSMGWLPVCIMLPQKMQWVVNSPGESCSLTLLISNHSM